MNIDFDKRFQAIWLGLFLGLFLFAPIVSSRSFVVVYFFFSFLGIFLNFDYFRSQLTFKKIFMILFFAIVFLCIQKFGWEVFNHFTIKKFIKSYLTILCIPLLSFVFITFKSDYYFLFKKKIIVGFFAALILILLILFLSKNIKLTTADLNRPLLYLLLIFWGITYYLKSEKKYFLLILLSLFFFLVTLKSYSETVLMCLIFGWITIGLMLMWDKLKFGIIIFSYFLLIALPFIFSDLCIQILMDGINLLPSYIPEKIFLDRLDIWRAVSNHIIESIGTLKFFIGDGFEATRFVIKMPTENIIAYQLPTISHPHNIILQIWLEFGVLGIALSAWLLTICFKWLLAQDKITQPYWFAFYISIFSTMNVNFSYGEGWVSTGMIFAFFVMREIWLPSPITKALAK